MPARRIGIAILLLATYLSAEAHAENTGAGSANGSSGGDAQISTWVIGAVNGGVSKPAGTKSCSPWALFDGSTFAGQGSPVAIDPSTGKPATIYFRLCDDKYQFVYVGSTSPTDVARVAYQEVAALVPKPRPAFSPPIDKMIVNFETWLGVTPQPPVSAIAAIPGLSATVTAEPTAIEWTTGSGIDGDTQVIHCEPWGSIESAQGGCAWTPAYPSIGKVTGTSDSRYHGTVTIVWQVSWQATNGAGGTLPELRTTTAVNMAVQEVQTIGG